MPMSAMTRLFGRARCRAASADIAAVRNEVSNGSKRAQGRLVDSVLLLGLEKRKHQRYEQMGLAAAGR